MTGSEPCGLVRRSSRHWQSAATLSCPGRGAAGPLSESNPVYSTASGASMVCPSRDLKSGERGASLSPWTQRPYRHAPSSDACAAHGWAATACGPTPREWRSISRCRRCASACREPVAGEGVCPDCWTRLSFIERPYCPRLGTPFVYDPGPNMLSMEAIANPPAYQRARAAVRYDDVAKVLVHALKYQDRSDLAPAMGRWMARAGTELLDGADILIPVPLHWSARLESPLQPVRCAGAHHRQRNRRSGRAGHAAAHPSDPAAGRIVADRTRPQRSRRVQGCGRPHQPDPGPSSRPDRRCSDVGRDSGRLRARPTCAPKPHRWTCWCSPGLWTP